MPGVTEHARSVVTALAPWATGRRLPNFGAGGSDPAAVYAPRTLARLRAAVRTYDPDGVLALGRALTR